MSIGVPIKVLHEAEGHIVTCETNTGEVYRGKLIEAEDNMNCQMTNIVVTYRDGRTAELENVYIRGSKIRFLILPDMLKNAPMFKRQGQKGGGAAGRGKSAILRAQGIFRTQVQRNKYTYPCIYFQLQEVEVVEDEEGVEVGQVRVVLEANEEAAVVVTGGVAETHKSPAFMCPKGSSVYLKTSNLWHFYHLKWFRMFISI